MNVFNLLTGTKILEEAESPINGKITVMRDLAWGTHILVDGITQSGGVVEGIWSKTLHKIRNSKSEIRGCLILGLGGGTTAKLVRKLWPGAEITGVDIDPVIVELGIRHLALGNSKTKIIIGDAYDFVKTSAHSLVPSAYDLIIVDLYVGREYPKKFESENYIRLARFNLARGGVAVFNRLYFGEKRREATKFGDKLDKIFGEGKVERFFPEANLMFLCLK
jgi:spermidine synthase